MYEGLSMITISGAMNSFKEKRMINLISKVAEHTTTFQKRVTLSELGRLNGYARITRVDTVRSPKTRP